MNFDFQNASVLLTNPSWDLIAIAAFLVLGFLYGLFSGKHRLVSVLLSTYIAAFLFENFYFVDSFLIEREPLEVVGIRIAIFLLLIFLVNLAISNFIRSDYNSRVIWQIFLLSFLEIGLLMAFAFYFLPAADFYEFSPMIEKVFASDNSFIIWLVAPLAVLWLILG